MARGEEDDLPDSFGVNIASVQIHQFMTRWSWWRCAGCWDHDAARRRRRENPTDVAKEETVSKSQAGINSFGILFFLKRERKYQFRQNKYQWRRLQTFVEGDDIRSLSWSHLRSHIAFLSLSLFSFIQLWSIASNSIWKKRSNLWKKESKKLLTMFTSETVLILMMYMEIPTSTGAPVTSEDQVIRVNSKSSCSCCNQDEG